MDRDQGSTNTSSNPESGNTSPAGNSRTIPPTWGSDDWSLLFGSTDTIGSFLSIRDNVSFKTFGTSIPDHVIENCVKETNQAFAQYNNGNLLSYDTSEKIINLNEDRVKLVHIEYEKMHHIHNLANSIMLADVVTTMHDINPKFGSIRFNEPDKAPEFIPPSGWTEKHTQAIIDYFEKNEPKSAQKPKERRDRFKSEKLYWPCLLKPELMGLVEREPGTSELDAITSEKTPKTIYRMIKDPKEFLAASDPEKFLEDLEGKIIAEEKVKLAQEAQRTYLNQYDALVEEKQISITKNVARLPEAERKKFIDQLTKEGFTATVENGFIDITVPENKISSKGILHQADFDALKDNLETIDRHILAAKTVLHLKFTDPLSPYVYREDDCVYLKIENEDQKENIADYIKKLNEKVKDHEHRTIYMAYAEEALSYVPGKGIKVSTKSLSSGNLSPLVIFFKNDENTKNELSPLLKMLEGDSKKSVTPPPLPTYDPTLANSSVTNPPAPPKPVAPIEPPSSPTTGNDPSNPPIAGAGNSQGILPEGVSWGGIVGALIMGLIGMLLSSEMGGIMSLLVGGGMAAMGWYGGSQLESYRSGATEIIHVSDPKKAQTIRAKDLDKNKDGYIQQSEMSYSPEEIASALKKHGYRFNDDHKGYACENATDIQLKFVPTNAAPQTRKAAGK